MSTNPAGPGNSRPTWIVRLREWTWAKRAHIAAGIAICLALSTAYVVWALQDLPDPNQNVLAAGNIIFLDRNGKLIEDWNPRGENHVSLNLDQMGKYGPPATLAAEDRNFYHHGAIDMGSTLRALWVDATTMQLTEGGSTITQQLVKIQLLTPEKSLARKAHETVLAIGMEQRFSKDQILTMYLNRVYYGHGSYGIGAAARTYFGVDAKDLSPAQAAFIAGLIQAPNTYDPQNHYSLARQRELYVLNGMVATGALTSKEADTAQREDIQSELKIQPVPRQSKAPHFVDYVLTKLEAQFGSAAIQQGGFVVHTTLDLNIQALAEQAVAVGVKDLSWADANNSAMLAADPKTGQILAWVGSADYFDDSIGGQFDVVLSPRQPGSTFKPYVYEAALRDHKITLATILNDEPQNFNGYTPHDFDNRGLGPITAREALVRSRNIPAVEVAQKEGMDPIIALAHSMGITTTIDPGLASAIGASAVTMYDHVQGYQVFANQGRRVDLSAITSIDDQNGNTIFRQQSPNETDVLTPAQAYLITDVLKQYQYTWGFNWNRQMASKTGTTDDGHGGIPDAWVMAYNPNIVVGAWMGNTGPNGKGGVIKNFGGQIGTTEMATFINGLPGNMRDWYTQPDGIIKGCPNGSNSSEIFLNDPGSTPCPSAMPTNTPTPTMSRSPVPTSVPSPTPLPSLPIPSPSSQPSPQPSPSPAPSPSPKASP